MISLENKIACFYKLSLVKEIISKITSTVATKWMRNLVMLLDMYFFVEFLSIITINISQWRNERVIGIILFSDQLDQTTTQS